MSSRFYRGISRIASKQIRRYGVEAELLVRAPAGKTWDPDPDSSNPPTVIPVRLVKDSQAETYRARSAVQAGDVTGILSPVNVTADPKLADALRIGGVLYELLRVEPVEPGPVVVVYEFHCRR